MKISIDTALYNEKRYGKPYIAILCPTTGLVLRWGTWIGTPGNAGMLEIEAAAGAVVMTGQKDSRGNNGTPGYALVRSDGTLDSMTKVQAIKQARAVQADKATAAAAAPQAVPEPTLADLLAALGATTTTTALQRIQQLLSSTNT